MPVHVDSTTDSEAEVRVAAGRPPGTTASRADTEPASATSPDVVEEASEDAKPASETLSDSEPESENQDSTPKGKPNSLQKRIDKLVRTIYEERNEKQELADRLAALEAKVGKKSEAKEENADEAQSQPSKKPLPENFTTYEDYVEALSDWKVEQKLQAADQKRQQADAQKVQQDAYQQALANYNDRLAEARERYEDFDEVLQEADEPLPDYLQQAIVRAEIGPDIAYYLAKNPKTYQQILKQDPYSAVLSLGKIEASLAAREENPNDSSSVSVQKDRPVSPAKKIAPMRPVGGTVKSSKSLDEMDYQEYRRKREEQLKRRYR